MKLDITKKRINSLVRPDSITTSFNDFLITHVKMGQLFLFKKYEDNPEMLSDSNHYDENTLFDQLILNPNNEHRFVIVYGQSGTGKSHLIRWFDAKLQQEKDDNEIVLFVSRNDNTLKGTIRQLLAKEEIINMVDTDVYNRLLESSTPIEENKLKNLIYFRLIAEIENDDIEYEGIIKRNDKRKISDFLSDSLIKKELLKKDGPIERLYVKVAENDTIVDRDIIAEFKPSDFEYDEDLLDEMMEKGSSNAAKQMYKKFGMDFIGEEPFNNKLARYLNKFVGKVIQSSVGIQPSDFQNVFIEIREALHKQNKNLTLFIEDITSFTGVDEELLNALLVEHTGVNAGKNLCRINSIVGTTREYFRDKFRDNFRDRITNYVYIPESIFTENQLFEFCAKYINAMSLEESVIAEWVKQGANSNTLPVHQIEQGVNWDYTRIDNTNIELPLYPFTKQAILNLYNEVIFNDERKRTPRYIIQYIIEPVVREVINDVSKFPSKQFNKSVRNSSLEQKIQLSVTDEKVRNRLYTFMNIWGDGTFDKIITDNTITLAGINEEIYKELDLPIIDVSEIKYENVHPQLTITKPIVQNKPLQEKNELSDKVQKEYKRVADYLDMWRSSGIIDLTSSGGTSGKIKNVIDYMKDYLFDSIDWQIEGVSYDNVNRIRNNKSLFKLEGQNNSEDSFLFSYDSYFIILAFLRYDLYGNKTWNYDGYEWDLYQISEWVYNCREDLIMYVKKCNNECDANYVEAAFILDTYFMILSGQFSGLNLNDICVEDYLKNDYSKNYQLEGHEKLWKDLFNLYDDYEDRNNSHYGIARKYFNLIQGGGTKVVVLNYLELESLVSKIIKNRLNYSNEKEQLNDKSSQRKNIIQKLSSIQSRLEKVANQEIDAIKDNLIIVKKYFKNSNISKQDVSNMWELFEKFYRVTNDAKMPVPFTLPNKNSVDFEKMAESYNRINILNENSDKLSILMAFSTKPEQHIKLLANIINSVEKNVATVEKEVSNSSIVIDYSDDENKYDEILGIAKATNLLLEREGIVC